MCKFYAHSHPCGHVKTVFANFCTQGAMMQKYCGKGEIWQTVKIEKDCRECYEEPEPAVSRSKAGAGAVGAGRRKISRR